MIVRMWRGTTSHATAEDYVRHLEATVFPALRTLDGFRGAEVLRRQQPADVEFVVLTRWESIDSIRQFAGDAVDVAVVPAAARALLIRFDSRVTHWEIASP